MEIKTIDGKVKRGGIESQIWLRMFFSGMIIRPSCTECKFRSRYRNSDFTIWDCFNSYKFDKNMDESIGTTRILIHTEKGKHIFEEIEDQFNFKIIDAELAVTGVKEMISSPSFNPMREAFFEDYNILPMKDLTEKYFPNTPSVKIKSIIRLCLNKIGLDIVLKRILKRG